jgi:hypothetical protein
MTALFQCDACFEVPERRIFVLSGHIVSGAVREGMHVLISFNSQLSMAVEINSVEQINAVDSTDMIGITHIVESDDELSLLKGLNIGGELLKIIEPNGSPSPPPTLLK